MNSVVGGVDMYHYLKRTVGLFTIINKCYIMDYFFKKLKKKIFFILNTLIFFFFKSKSVQPVCFTDTTNKPILYFRF